MKNILKIAYLFVVAVIIQTMAWAESVRVAVHNQTQASVWVSTSSEPQVREIPTQKSAEIAIADPGSVVWFYLTKEAKSVAIAVLALGQRMRLGKLERLMSMKLGPGDKSGPLSLELVYEPMTVQRPVYQIDNIKNSLFWPSNNLNK